MNLIEGSDLVTSQARADAHETAAWLSNRIFHTQLDAGFPLVEGEEGPAYIGEALGRLVTGRVKREGGGPVGQIEAWMQAEIVAASVAAAHEFETGEPVSSVEQGRLQSAFTAFGTQAI
ncbi:MAG TPA: hypothetical protein VLH86_02190 [Patescibacteria group bacterium]|nr:hypothetical protein [Patescibacteria group bacterium]